MVRMVRMVYLILIYNYIVYVFIYTIGIIKVLEKKNQTIKKRGKKWQRIRDDLDGYMVRFKI